MKFKPEDFIDVCNTGDRPQRVRVADFVNEKLAKESILFFKLPPIDQPIPISDMYSQVRMPHHTHSGRLICIEELPKEPCKHEPVRMVKVDSFSVNPVYDISVPHTCARCGVELVAEWKEAKK